MSYSTRADFSTIAGWIAANARVLDLGCGDGSLLAYLRESRGAFGYGIEIDGLYVDTAIERWERLTGRKAQNAQGQTFEQVKLEREGQQ